MQPRGTLGIERIGTGRINNLHGADSETKTSEQSSDIMNWLCNVQIRGGEPISRWCLPMKLYKQHTDIG